MVILPPKKRESGVLKEVWVYCNQLSDVLRTVRLMPSGNRGVTVSQTSNGTLVSVTQKQSSALQTTRYRVKSVGDDYLVCNQWDGTTAGTADIKIAKPFRLRKTPFHGKTITYDDGVSVTYAYSSNFNRNATSGSETENQIIIPEYNTGFDEIWAIDAETGVDECNQIDMNCDGRSWAKV
jgi:hypothetical protein